jgi:hypothetical protein
MGKKIIYLLMFAGIISKVSGQNKEDIVLKAMKDELSRNLKELKFEDFERPFYINYGVEDVTEYEIAATMGSLLRSHQEHTRNKYVRVMVGDYQFNDESLNSNGFNQPDAAEIELPLDDDYFGIRRAFWVTTDNIYKSAARQFKKNGETLKEKNKTLDEMPHRRFAQLPPSQLTKEAVTFQFDKSVYDKYIRDISEIFNAYPLLEASAVYLRFTDGYSYFVNSEGTFSKTPSRLCVLQAYAQRRTDDGESLSDQLNYYAFTPDKLPPFEQMKADIIKMCEEMTKASSEGVFDDEYEGPVLCIGKSVAEMMASGFFSYKETLEASDALPNPNGNGYRVDNSTSLDNKIGKVVVNEQFTIKSRPTLANFQGVDLVGSYVIDREGVVPPEELILVDRGILKNLLNDRSLIKPTETANGHSYGQAVTEVVIQNTFSLSDLKKKLVEKAKAEGLEYAIIVNEPGRRGNGRTITKVSVADGKEEVLRSAVLEQLNMKDMRELVGATKDLKAYNLERGNERVVSYIVPAAMLMGKVEVKKAQVPLYKQEQYVPSPVAKKQ